MPRGDGTGPPGGSSGSGRGRGGGPMGRMRNSIPGTGPGKNCLCPSCGAIVAHQAGLPCYDVKCPRCGKTMARG